MLESLKPLASKASVHGSIKFTLFHNYHLELYFQKMHTPSRASMESLPNKFIHGQSKNIRTQCQPLLPYYWNKGLKNVQAETCFFMSIKKNRKILKWRSLG